MDTLPQFNNFLKNIKNASNKLIETIEVGFHSIFENEELPCTVEEAVEFTEDFLTLKLSENNLSKITSDFNNKSISFNIIDRGPYSIKFDKKNEFIQITTIQPENIDEYVEINDVVWELNNKKFITKIQLNKILTEFLNYLYRAEEIVSTNVFS